MFETTGALTVALSGALARTGNPVPGLALPIPASGTSLAEYFLVPLFGMLVVAGLVLVLRWSHQPVRKGGPSPAARAGDHGMLVPVVSVPYESDARAKVRQLAELGIRATVTPTRAEHLVLVWPWQAQAARDCLSRHSR